MRCDETTYRHRATGQIPQNESEREIKSTKSLRQAHRQTDTPIDKHANRQTDSKQRQTDKRHTERHTVDTPYKHTQTDKETNRGNRQRQKHTQTNKETDLNLKRGEQSNVLFEALNDGGDKRLRFAQLSSDKFPPTCLPYLEEGVDRHILRGGTDKNDVRA